MLSALEFAIDATAYDVDEAVELSDRLGRAISVLRQGVEGAAPAPDPKALVAWKKRQDQEQAEWEAERKAWAKKRKAELAAEVAAEKRKDVADLRALAQYAALDVRAAA